MNAQHQSAPEQIGAAQDSAVWRKIKQKLARRRARRRRIFSAACVVAAAVLASTGILLTRPSETKIVYNVGQLHQRDANFSDMERFCRENKLLLPNTETDMIDFLGAKVYDRDEQICAYRAYYRYNDEIGYDLFVTADPLLTIEAAKEAMRSELSLRVDSYLVAYLPAETVTYCYAQKNGRQYYLEIETGERRMRPILANLFGDRP